MTIGESALNSPLISTLTKKSHKNSWSVLDAHRAPGKHIERFTKILICNHQLDLLLWFKDLQNMNKKCKSFDPMGTNTLEELKNLKVIISIKK